MTGRYLDERKEWLSLTPARRMMESAALWQTYFLLGGSLDPEPDPQSPFNFSRMPHKKLAHRRTGMHNLRRR